MNVAQANVDAYAEEAANKDLSDYNLVEQAMLAKNAGTKYVVVTARHHEGFAMYDSKVSDFTIVKFTKYDKNPMLSLSQKDT